MKKSNNFLGHVAKFSCAKCELSTVSKIPNKKDMVERSLSTTPQAKPTPAEVQKTALYKLHQNHKGKLVNFAGYYLPIQYENTSIMASHLHTRSNCSIFDVSHMLQSYVRGKNAIQFLESLCVTDIAGMKINASALSLFTNEINGGIIDDLIITKINDELLYLVSNASRRMIDQEILYDRLDFFKSNGKDVDLEFLESSEQSLIAVQGPKTAEILQSYIDVDLKNLYFMQSAKVTIGEVENCRLTRCGYTGEDGVEISIPSKKVTKIVQLLLQNESVKLAGLGARDTLRMEAGLCLHGNDIDETTTPVEAGLAWTIGRRRKNEMNFPGSKIIMDQMKNGIFKKRIGLIKFGGPPARTGSKIIGFDDDVIGLVTSGCPSPSLGVNVAMGYVQASYAKSQTEIRVKIRDNLYNAAISKMPFVNAKYFTKPK